MPHTKLGFWNRLAIVASGLFSLIAATWTVLDQRAETVDKRSEGHSECIAAAASPDSDGTLNATVCSDIWSDVGFMPGWSDWFAMLGAYLALCVATYVIVFVLVALAKWVLRGREA